MDSMVDRTLLLELGRDIVRQVAPLEEPLYPLLSGAYVDDPDRALSGRDAVGPLAFGLPEVYVLLTPVVLAAIDAAVQYVGAQAAARGAKATRDALRRLFRRPAPSAAEPAEAALTLTRQQWIEVHAIVHRVAVKAGVPDTQADLIADAVVGQGNLPS